MAQIETVQRPNNLENTTGMTGQADVLSQESLSVSDRDDLGRAARLMASGVSVEMPDLSFSRTGTEGIETGSAGLSGNDAASIGGEQVNSQTFNRLRERGASPEVAAAIATAAKSHYMHHAAGKEGETELSRSRPENEPAPKINQEDKTEEILEEKKQAVPTSAPETITADENQEIAKPQENLQRQDVGLEVSQEKMAAREALSEVLPENKLEARETFKINLRASSQTTVIPARPKSVA